MSHQVSIRWMRHVPLLKNIFQWLVVRRAERQLKKLGISYTKKRTENGYTIVTGDLDERTVRHQSH